MPEMFYRGAGRIRAFRGGAGTDGPEDWIASATSRFGRRPEGITRLADGTPLNDAIAADPIAWLGAEHVARHGADPALLVKLLDAGQRLPMHVHPDRTFAASHLASPYGKTEAWIVLEAVPEAFVHLGFTRDVEADRLASWVRDQDVAAMLAATNRVPITAGDTVVCPAGMPHAIGPGVLVVELQEPTDLSVLLEWRGLPVDPADAGAGLPMAAALECVDRRACPPERLAALRGRPLNGAAGGLLPAAADGFFVAERAGPGVLPPAFGVLVVTGGNGRLMAEAGGEVALTRGSTVVIPHAAGPCSVTGDVRGVRCLPAP